MCKVCVVKFFIPKKNVNNDNNNKFIEWSGW